MWVPMILFYQAKLINYLTICLELSNEFLEFKSRIASQVQSLQESFDKAVVDVTNAITDLRNRVGSFGIQQVILIYILIKQLMMNDVLIMMIMK